MKLYTEEQVLQIISNFKSEIHQNPLELMQILDVENIELLRFMDIKPIELPSDQDVINESNKWFSHRNAERYGFEVGAEYVINKIKGDK